MILHNYFEPKCVSDCDCNHDHKQQTTQHLHGVVCSASCNHEEHERTGFENTNYVNFTKEDVNEQINYAIKYYLDLQDTLF